MTVLPLISTPHDPLASQHLGFARLDLGRAVRQPVPEVIYAPGKTIAECVAITTAFLENSDAPVMITRLSHDQRDALIAELPPADHLGDDVMVWQTAETRPANVVVSTAGTSDLRVAHEAHATLVALGITTEIIADIGVAGIHRLFAQDVQEKFEAADAIIVCAGMEGALASVLGGLVACPVIAVPTSTGYGASFEGITALLAMHASCAPGIAVVGIDNGFGAAAVAARLLAPLLKIREGATR